MSHSRELDCIVIGYNELPFTQYEKLLRQYGEDSEAYRDFNLSFVEAGGQDRLYCDLMNYAVHRAKHSGNGDSTGNGFTEIFKSGDIPNLAAAYLTNFLNRRGHRSRYINLFQQEKERLAKWLEQDPLCVAITTTFYVLNFPVNNMVEFIREKNPDVKIIVGGPLIANHSRNYVGEELESALADMGADIYVVEGQGELTLSQIVACLKDKGDLGKVPNIFYRDGKRLHRTAPLPESNDMNENIIDWQLLANGDQLGSTLQTRTARSCAFSCAFCNYPTRAGKLTLTGIEQIERELDSMHALGYVNNVVFIDDTFNVPLPRFKDICRLMIEKDYGFKWFSYFRCSNSDEEAIELMAKSGCKGVFLGIESGSPTILVNMNKRATIEKYLTGVELLHQHGILTFGSFITGFPGENQQTVAETDDFIRASKLDYYRTQLWYCEHGTPIHQQREKYGIEGDGFVWSHDEMDSMEAMDAIERTFLTVDNAVWLPQWSYDFWIIPYLMGKGVDLDDFRKFTRGAQKLMALGVATVPEHEKARIEDQVLGDMVDVAKGWTGIR